MASIPACPKLFNRDIMKTRQYNILFSLTSNNKFAPSHFYKKVIRFHRSCWVKSQRNDENSPEIHTNTRHLEALDSYFSKNDVKSIDQEMSFCSSVSNAENEEPSSSSSSSSSSPPLKLPKKLEIEVDKDDELKAGRELGSLDNYFNRLKSGMSKNELSSSEEVSSKSNQMDKLHTFNGECDGKREDNSGFVSLESKDDENGSFLFSYENYRNFQPCDDASDLTLVISGLPHQILLILSRRACQLSFDWLNALSSTGHSNVIQLNLLISINIAVFLFEIASPIRNTDEENLTLPLVYGAKINHLILDGEWWRLVTPMFLHSGFLHVALGCWVLLTYGPQVCRSYGSFTFFLIYMLGGISGNLSSFLHTPELTVGGTGPVFATLGAWFIYQIQNKDTIPKEEAESLFQKAMITTLLSCFLSNLERVDDWTHLGALLVGVVYGCLTCPTMQLGNVSSQNGREDGIAIIRRQAGPCKSFIVFAIFILILSSLFFLFEAQLDTL